MLRQAGIGLFSVSLMLTGCDNGSSSSSSDLTYNGPTAPVAISASNADAVAASAAAEATSTETSNSLLVTGVQTSTTNSATEPTSMAILDRAMKFTKIIPTTASSNTTALAGVISTSTLDCSGGGTKTLTTNYQDPTLTQATSGDTFTYSYTNCIETDPNTGITELANGMVSGLLNRYSYTDSYTFDISASYGFENIKVTNMANGDYSWLDGALTLDVSGTGVSGIYDSLISGSSIVAETQTAGVTKQVLLTNFSFGYTSDHSTWQRSFDNDFTIASAGIGGSVTVLTVNPFVVNLGSVNPISGQLIVTGANNAKVRLTAQPDGTNAFLEYDIEPIDGVYETNATIPWMNL